MYEHTELTKSVAICPYNKSHLIPRSSIQKHIVKCEQKYPPGYKLMCPYNATHRLSKHEMQEHITVCPNRSISDLEAYAGAVKKHGSTSLMLHSENSSVIHCEESWDTHMDDDWKYLMSDEPSLPYDSDVSLKDIDISVQAKNLSDETLRPPRGFSEAMLKDVDEESCVDVQSVVSAMGVGRGKGGVKSDRMVKLIGLARGQSIDKNS